MLKQVQHDGCYFTPAVLALAIETKSFAKQTCSVKRDGVAVTPYNITVLLIFPPTRRREKITLHYDTGAL